MENVALRFCMDAPAASMTSLVCSMAMFQVATISRPSRTVWSRAYSRARLVPTIAIGLLLAISRAVSMAAAVASAA